MRKFRMPLIGLAAIVALCCAWSRQCPAQTPTPAPSPTPAYCSEVEQVYQIPAFQCPFPFLRFAETDGTIHLFSDGGDLGDANFDQFSEGFSGYTIEDTPMSPYPGGMTFEEVLAGHWEVATGEWVRIYTGTSPNPLDPSYEYVKAYLPKISGGEALSLYFGGRCARGISTYTDRWLCQTAYDAAATTPSPTAQPSPTPTRSPSPSPTKTPTPLPSATPSPTKTPSPSATPVSPTPSPSPTPAYCSTWMLLTDVTDIDIPVPASSVAEGWLIGIYTGLSSVDHLLGRTSDNDNSYEDWDAYAESWVRINIASQDEAVSIPAGYRVDVSSTGGTKHIRLPAVTIAAGGGTYYYVALDGSTYVDRWLCQTAWDAAAITPTPTPSVTPTPSTTPTPQPCEGRDWYQVTGISAGKIHSVRGASTTTLRYEFYSLSDELLGYIYDRQNNWSSGGTEATAEPVWMRIYSLLPTTTVAGDWIALTSTGGTAKKVYIPPATWGAATQVDMWIGSDGATYSDQFLCNVAKAVPTPSVTPTPYVGLCLQWTLDPFTPDQTSMWEEFNTMRDDLFAFANGGIGDDCFKSDFAIGWGRLGANCVGEINLRDYIVSNVNCQTGMNDSRTTLDDSLTAFDMQSTIQFNDVFNINHSMSFTKYTDTTHAFSVVCRNTSLQEQSDSAYNLKVYAINDDGETNPALVIDRDNGWIGLNVQSEPAARLDVKGSTRIRGLATFDQAMATNWVDFTTSDTTPSVALGMNFKTNNATAAGTSPVIISRFDGGVQGQRIYVLCQDNRTAFSNTSAASLWLNNRIWTTDGVNWVPHTEGPYWTCETDYLVSFVNNGGQWYEHYTSRFGFHWNDQTTTPSSEWEGASDYFESNSLVAGDGLWEGDWEVGGSTRLVSGYSSPDGNYCVRLGSASASGYVRRKLNTTAAPDSITLSFRAYPLGSAGSVVIYKALDGSSWTTLTTVTGLTGNTWNTVSRTLSLANEDYSKIGNYGIGIYNGASIYTGVDAVTLGVSE